MIACHSRKSLIISKQEVTKLTPVNLKMYLNMFTIKLHIHKWYCVDIHEAVALKRGTIFIDSPCALLSRISTRQKTVEAEKFRAI